MKKITMNEINKFGMTNNRIGGRDLPWITRTRLNFTCPNPCRSGRASHGEQPDRVGHPKDPDHVGGFHVAGHVGGFHVAGHVPGHVPGHVAG